MNSWILILIPYLFLLDLGTKQMNKWNVVAQIQEQQQNNERLKILTECGIQTITLHIRFNEQMLVNQKFTDWIIVGNTLQPDCRLKGNGELRYIVQIAIMKDPCGTKMVAPGVFQNTLRIASFPGLILSDDINFEFKCAYGFPELLEYKLTKEGRPTPDNQMIERPSFQANFNNPSLTSSSTVLPSPFIVTSGFDRQQHKFSPFSAPPLQQNEFGAKSRENLQFTNEKENFPINLESEDVRERQQHRQEDDIPKNPNLITNDGDFDVSRHWEERRNSISSNIVIIMGSLMGIFLVGFVLVGIIYSVRQYINATKSHARHNQFNAGSSSPGNSSFSPASNESREQPMEWHRNDSNSTALARNSNGKAYARENPFLHEQLNLEPLNFHQQTTTRLCKEGSQMTNLLKDNLASCGTTSSSSGLSLQNLDDLKRNKMFGTDNKVEKIGKLKENREQNIGKCNDNAINEELNAAACRSITEIYRSAEIKLKSMMSNEGSNGEHKGIIHRQQMKSTPLTFEGEYSTPKRVQSSREREQQLIACVNKIRGYGTRKLTEQEMLRWRQLIRNDEKFANIVYDCRTIEALHRLSELPQYRLLFTKLKWTQIVQCIADEIFQAKLEGESIEKIQKNIPLTMNSTIRRNNGPTLPLPPSVPKDENLMKIYIENH